jgi:hypothetical protein
VQPVTMTPGVEVRVKNWGDSSPTAVEVQRGGSAVGD